MNKSEIYLNELIVLQGLAPFSENEIKDFDLTGNESDQVIVLLAGDIISEHQTQKQENKNAWRYEH